MKKSLLLVLSFVFAGALFAQDTLTYSSPKKKKIDLSGRPNDHFLLQLGYAGWAGVPDTIKASGFSKSINAYFMLDFPFKTNPKLSIAIGPGIATDNIIFKKYFIGIKETTANFQMSDRSDTTHFKKTKLTTVYLEAPVEFRFTADPMNSDKSFKFALGVKVGTMLKAYTKSKDLQLAAGTRSYTEKESSKQYFNSTRLSAMARIGWGHFSLFGSYQITTLLKETAGAEIRPFAIGLTLSGL